MNEGAFPAEKREGRGNEPTTLPRGLTGSPEQSLAESGRGVASRVMVTHHKLLGGLLAHLSDLVFVTVHGPRVTSTQSTDSTVSRNYFFGPALSRAGANRLAAEAL